MRAINILKLGTSKGGRHTPHKRVQVFYNLTRYLDHLLTTYKSLALFQSWWSWDGALPWREWSAVYTVPQMASLARTSHFSSHWSYCCLRRRVCLSRRCWGGVLQLRRTSRQYLWVHAYMTVFENILVAGLAYKFVLVYGTCTMVHVKASYTNYFSKMSLSLEHSRWGWIWKSSPGEFTLRVWTLLVHPLSSFPPITYTVS